MPFPNPIHLPMPNQLFFLMKVSFNFFFPKRRKGKWKEGKKEGRASLLESDATSTPEIFSGKSSVVTFLWSQSNDWPEDSPYVETCSYAVRYWNLEPLKWRSSWTWFWIKWYSWKLSEVHTGLHSSRHLWSNQPFRRCLLGGSWITITAPIPGIYEYATEGTLQMWVKIQILRWKDYSGLYRCDSLITWILQSGKSSWLKFRGREGRSKRNLKWERETWDPSPFPLWRWKKEATSQEMQTTSRRQK